MPGPNSLPLPDDVIDRVLTFLPDFLSLQAAILSSMQFYGVFRTHPNSIIYAVAFNLVGPSLPQAIRVLRYDPPDAGPPDASPWAETDPVSPISKAEIMDLAKIATVAKELEDLFSSRQVILILAQVSQALQRLLLIPDIRTEHLK